MVKLQAFYKERVKNLLTAPPCVAAYVELKCKNLIIIKIQASQHKNPFLKIMYTEMMHLCKKFMKYYKEMCLKYHCRKY